MHLQRTGRVTRNQQTLCRLAVGCAVHAPDRVGRGIQAAVAPQEREHLRAVVCGHHGAVARAQEADQPHAGAQLARRSLAPAQGQLLVVRKQVLGQQARGRPQLLAGGVKVGCRATRTGCAVQAGCRPGQQRGRTAGSGANEQPQLAVGRADAGLLVAARAGPPSAPEEEEQESCAQRGATRWWAALHLGWNRQASPTSSCSRAAEVICLQLLMFQPEAERWRPRRSLARPASSDWARTCFECFAAPQLAGRSSHWHLPKLGRLLQEGADRRVGRSAGRSSPRGAAGRSHPEQPRRRSHSLPQLESRHRLSPRRSQPTAGQAAARGRGLLTGVQVQPWGPPAAIWPFDADERTRGPRGWLGCRAGGAARQACSGLAACSDRGEGGAPLPNCGARQLAPAVCCQSPKPSLAVHRWSVRRPLGQATYRSARLGRVRSAGTCSHPGRAQPCCILQRGCPCCYCCWGQHAPEGHTPSWGGTCSSPLVSPLAQLAPGSGQPPGAAQGQPQAARRQQAGGQGQRLSCLPLPAGSVVLQQQQRRGST